MRIRVRGMPNRQESEYDVLLPRDNSSSRARIRAEPEGSLSPHALRFPPNSIICILNFFERIAVRLAEEHERITKHPPVHADPAGFALGSRCVSPMDVINRHARQPCLALVAALAPRAVHAGLGVIMAVGDAFDCGFQQGGDALLPLVVGWRGLNPDYLRRLGFDQEHQVERRRGFADGLQTAFRRLLLIDMVGQRLPNGRASQP